MTHTATDAAHATQTAAHYAALVMGPLEFLDTMHALTSRAVDTRPNDWVVVFKFGPWVRLYQPLEGGPRLFRRPPGRCVVTYPVKRWLIALARDLWGRFTGRWAKAPRRATAEHATNPQRTENR